MLARSIPGLFLLLLLLPTIAAAQAPHVISFQGFLTDTTGTPVADGNRTATFKIYSAPSGGSALWTESQSIATSGGQFSVELGSITPLTGIQWDENLWLGITVSPDPEMTPRTRLGSSPATLGIVSPLQDTLKIMTSDLSSDGTERMNEDLTIWASDAMVGLYSNPGGSAGSGIQLGELNGGLFTNKWSIFRGTTGASAGLRFTFGQDPNYAVNATRVEFDTTGAVRASSFVASDQFRYDSPKTRTLHIPAADFHAARHEDLTGSTDDWHHQLGYIECYTCAGNPLDFVAPVSLPEGAEITSIKLYYMDNDAIHDTQYSFSIYRRAPFSSGTQTLGSSPVTTSGASTSILSGTLDTSANSFRFVNNTDYMYWAQFTMDHLTSDSWSARRFYGMTIEYKVQTVE